MPSFILVVTIENTLNIIIQELGIMVSVELKFLSQCDNIILKDSDFNVYSCGTKKHTVSVYEETKQIYALRRGLHDVKFKSHKLKIKLAKLEEYIKRSNVLSIHWVHLNQLCLVLSSGILCYITLHFATSDIVNIKLDKSCIGKFNGNVAAVLHTDSYVVIAYAENSATIIQLTKNEDAKVHKIDRLDPKIQTVELFGPLRKASRVLSSSKDRNGNVTLLVWSCNASGEIFPWSPEVRGEDRADVHFYLLTGTSLHLIAYHQTEHEAVNVELSKKDPNIFYTIHQKPRNKLGMFVEGSKFEIIDGIVEHSKSWSCNTSAAIHSVSRSENNVVMACVDSSIIVRTEGGLLNRVRAPFIPSVLCWSGDVILVADDRGRITCWDRTLNPLNSRLDLANFLTHQPTLQLLSSQTRNEMDPTHRIVVVFNEGPVALLILNCQNTLWKHIESSSITGALTILKSYCWESNGDTCLSILHSIVKELFRKPLNDVIENLIQEAIGTFLSLTDLNEPTIELYGPHVRDIGRKFCHHLVRYKCLDKALSLAVDLDDYDLFVDIQQAAKKLNCKELEEEAKEHAKRRYNECVSSCSSCYSNCSRDTTSSEISLRPKKRPGHRKAPPLPQFTHNEVTEGTDHSSRVESIPQTLQSKCREVNYWKVTEKQSRQAMHKVVDIVPKSIGAGERKYYEHVYQRELKQENTKIEYKPVYSQKSVLSSKSQLTTLHHSKTSGSAYKSNGNALIDFRYAKPFGEKNKVKFSDTVTVNVLSENVKMPCVKYPDPRRELADSLPLSHPDLYLKDFNPLSDDTTYFV